MTAQIIPFHGRKIEPLEVGTVEIADIDEWRRERLKMRLRAVIESYWPHDDERDPSAA